MGLSARPKKGEEKGIGGYSEDFGGQVIEASGSKSGQFCDGRDKKSHSALAFLPKQ
jgi:hypothetical protein